MWFDNQYQNHHSTPQNFYDDVGFDDANHGRFSSSSTFDSTGQGYDVMGNQLGSTNQGMQFHNTLPSSSASSVPNKKSERKNKQKKNDANEDDNDKDKDKDKDNDKDKDKDKDKEDNDHTGSHYIIFNSGAQRTSGFLACLGKDCEFACEAWKETKCHMKNCEKYKRMRKTWDIKQSAEKGEILRGKGVTTQKFFKDKPNDELELVQVIKAYYESGETNGVKNSEHRKHVMAKAIRAKYGKVPFFGKFGFGTFLEFSKRHGLEVYN